MLLGFTSTSANGFATGATKVVIDFVSSYYAKPTSKCIAGPILLKAANLHRYRLKHLLEYIGHLLFRQLLFATPMINKRRVEQDKPFPGVGFVTLQSPQQT